MFLFPQEKFYLQNDKNEYISGEKVWFRVYLADALTHRPVSDSRYSYVELTGEANDSIYCRVKIKPDSLSLHHGYLPIPPNLPTGNYFLRVYTRYMVNQDDSYFFTREIRVFRPGKVDIRDVVKNKSDDYDMQFFPEGGYLIDGAVCRGRGIDT